MTFDDLKAAEYNPRRIRPKADAGLRASMLEFGDLSGVVWNQRTGNLVCGHQRVSELKARGATIHGDKIVLGSESFLIRVVDWDIETEKLANVTANNPHIAGEFSDMLEGLIEEVRADGEELAVALTGFANLGEAGIPNVNDSDDNGTEEEAPAERPRYNPHAVTIAYSLIFDSADQKARWKIFCDSLASEGLTPAQALSKWIEQTQGVSA